MNTVKCEDDCDVAGDMQQYPTLQTCNASTPACCGFQVAFNCANTAITLSATDPCGNINNQGPYYVRYDSESPNVDVTVPEFTQNKYRYKVSSSLRAEMVAPGAGDGK